MTVTFNQTGKSFTATATGSIDGFGFDNSPQASACLVTNTGAKPATVQYSVTDTGPQYAQWPTDSVPGFGTVVLPGRQQVLLTNTQGVAATGVTAYATFVCAGEDTTTLVFNLGAV